MWSGNRVVLYWTYIYIGCHIEDRNLDAASKLARFSQVQILQSACKDSLVFCDVSLTILMSALNLLNISYCAELWGMTMHSLRRAGFSD
jgi:hypothetical protein